MFRGTFRWLLSNQLTPVAAAVPMPSSSTTVSIPQPHKNQDAPPVRSAAAVLEALHYRDQIVSSTAALAQLPRPLDPSPQITSKLLKHQLVKMQQNMKQRAELHLSTTHPTTTGSEDGQSQSSFAEASTCLYQAIAAALNKGGHLGTLLEGRRLDNLPPLADIVHKDINTSFRRADVRFSNVFLGGVFTNCQFDMVAGEGCSFAGAEVRWCTFTAANLAAADLEGAYFAHCDFTRANLTGANCHGTTFFHCIFGLTECSRMRVNGATTFHNPEGWELTRRAGWTGPMPKVILENPEANSSLPPPQGELTRQR